MGWKAGASRQEVTSWEEGIYLFGWGNPNNKALGVATPLYARALVLDDGTTPIALVLVDIGVITYTIRRFTLQALRDAFPDCPIRDEHILLTATHTHSAASGYSEYLFYGLSGPGVSQTIVDTYAQGIAKAIGTAWRDREPASVRVGEDDLPLSIPVAFNRSLTPYQQNAEYRDRNDLQSDEATWRRMTLLRVDSLARKVPLAVFSWFATHATSVHANHTEIHGDNRGLAAIDYDKQLQERYGHSVVTAFAQESAGDITPNFRWDAARKINVGAKEDDHDSAQFVADALRHLADNIVTNEDRLRPLSPTVAGDLAYVRLAGYQFEDTNGEELEVGDAVLGLGFIEGTKEGPGPLRPFHPVLRRITNMLRNARGGRGRELRKHHGNKLPFLDTGKGHHGNAFGLFTLQRPLIPSAVDSTVRTYKYYRSIQAVDDHPWTPVVLPFQVLRIGELWLATVPGEPTTTVGRRLREALRKDIVDSLDGVAAEPTVVIAAYSNDYTSYVTTFEEYQEQWYEGASTIFGIHTAAGVQHILQELTRAVAQGRSHHLPVDAPPIFEDWVFERRDYRSAPASVRGHAFSDET